MILIIKTVDSDEPIYTDHIINKKTGEVATPEEVKPLITDLLESLGALDYLMVPVRGRERYFNPKNISWVEAV